ncbi:MAG: hypothetical protein A4E62_01680 [Syntrophorhabdus sp. PtaU1.Bin002]|nr:MAG: hypothetical protein A4E62_01680 [Syntrophorhabdus sp. PtaU1.Bin002]
MTFHNTVQRRMFAGLSLISLCFVVTFGLIGIKSNLPTYLSLALLLSLWPFFWMIRRTTTLFEPFTVISFYYYLFCFSAFWLYMNDFESSLLIPDITNRYHLDRVFLETLLLSLTGYFLFFLSYTCVIKPYEKNICYANKIRNLKVDDNIVVILICVFATISLANFVWVLYKTAGLNIVEYLSMLGYYGSHMKEEFGLSTVGYNFIYPAVVLGIYERKKDNMSKPVFAGLMMIYLLCSVSMARITGLVTDLMIFGYLSTILNRSIEKGTRTKRRQIFFVATLVLVGTGLFFYRMYSDLYRIHAMGVDEFIDLIGSHGLSILFGVGNAPNFGIVMKIYSQWEADIGFLNGSTMLTFLHVFLPSIMTEDVAQQSVSWYVKNIWYGDISGGGFPPTIIGDLYANFDILGVFAGMALLGILFARVYSAINRSSSYFSHVFYAFLLFKFVLILPKAEFSRLGFILQPISIYATYLMIVFITQATMHKNFGGTQSLKMTPTVD